MLEFTLSKDTMLSNKVPKPEIFVQLNEVFKNDQLIVIEFLLALKKIYTFIDMFLSSVNTISIYNDSKFLLICNVAKKELSVFNIDVKVRVCTTDNFSLGIVLNTDLKLILEFDKSISGY